MLIPTFAYSKVDKNNHEIIVLAWQKCYTLIKLCRGEAMGKWWIIHIISGNVNEFILKGQSAIICEHLNVHIF